jgi:NAD(P)H dehydrogenase (quinone)
VNVLIVVAHPTSGSLTKAAAAAAVAGLQRAGHDVTVLDLYERQFVAAMSREERAAYHTDTPLISDDTREHAQLVTDAEVLVFVYPTWWGGLPAILQGWFERVLVPGVAFTFDESSQRVRPALTRLRRIVGISTYGSPAVYVRLTGDGGRRVITRALRMAAGWRTSTTWLALYHVDEADDAVRTTFLERIDDAMAGLT